MKKTVSLTCVVLLIFFTVAAFAAGEKATKEECVAKCKEAAKMVKEIGLDAALKKLNDKNGPFVWKDSYVFCIDIEKGTNLAHPILPVHAGKVVTGLKDKNGKLFFAEYVKVARSEGEGWVRYVWPKPGEKTPSQKITYVYKVPDMNIAMLAGIYE
ncbi:cache domain-containing protein [Desulfococcaceae bacterium HSG8]|nr:cache domain-containing protein [Desulfococcaceae bacterium HSG8]